MIDPAIKLVAIVGPTASGKTALAIHLAQNHGGEIVCADSRTIYKDLNIGTAKPTPEERALVPHHLLDLVRPDEKLTVAEFQRLAEVAITDIAARGRVPFLVGGSGLYVDSILYDYQFPPATDELRVKLEGLSDEGLRQRLIELDPAAAEAVDMANRRRVVRAIETAGVGKTKRSSVRPNTLVLGIKLNKEVAQLRIEQRVKKMLEEGFIAELEQVGETYGWDCEAMTSSGFEALKAVILDHQPLEVGTEALIKSHMQLMKKQLTWFKRNHEIKWLEDPAQAEPLVQQFLASGNPAV